MCGLAGFLEPPGFRPAEEMRRLAARMASTLRHRGPDDDGVWADARAGAALGFRRLAIQDLSPDGRQPMESACGRYVTVFNGEIYNFRTLRSELEARGSAAFRGRSDTEVLLAAVSAWGLEPALRRFIGMFAFALWDRSDRTLFLVRDRLGIKPMYYGWAGRTLLFGSELKALRAHPAFRAEIDRDAVSLFLRHNYIPCPHTIYRGLFKLPPGTTLAVRPGDGPTSAPRPYWSLLEAAERGCREPLPGTEADAVEELDALLSDAVGLRLTADVPLGAFLSGGIDSSTVVSLMQAQSSRPVKTFTIGFREASHNEAAHAAAIARHLGTEHTEFCVTPQDAMDVVPLLPTLYDEPFADSSQIPTFLVSRLCRTQVTVSLSGDGGDELFCGYPRYDLLRRLWRALSAVPLSVRRAVAAAVLSTNPERWMPAVSSLLVGLPAGVRQGLDGHRVEILAAMAGQSDPIAAYRLLVSHQIDPCELVPGSIEPPTAFTEGTRLSGLLCVEQGAMALDAMTYLPDDILTKVDRASMGVSLEACVPLLDHRVVEFAWRLPHHLKTRDGTGKWALRRVLDRYVPAALVDRRKMGFAMPVGAWLRGPLRDWAESLLDAGRIRQEGILAPAPVGRMWQEHLAGRRCWKAQLWDLLMFQAWLEAEQRGPQPTCSVGAASHG